MASNYSVQIEHVGGQDIYVLRDDASLAEVRVVPALGNNCIAFQRSVAGVRCDLLAQPRDLDQLANQPSHWGNPVLFPFPNRIRSGAFHFDGETFDLHDTSSNGNAIHGLLMRRKWRVERSGAGDGGAWVEAVGSTDDLPDILEHWPFPFRFSLTYRLQSGELSIDAAALNTGKRAMPMGFGIHPYFNAPFAHGSNAADCEALVPASHRWILDEHLMPTGERAPVVEDRDLRQFRQVGQIKFDDVFTGLALTDGHSECMLRDRRVGLELYVRSDPQFREMVVFTPPWHSAICFEPYTCTSDAFNLAARGVDSGMRILPAGESWRGIVRVGVRPS